MLSLPPAVQVWVSVQPVHMGKGHDGLAALVQRQLGRDPLSGHVFAFVGRRRDRCKLLWWEPGGYVVLYKRLDQGKLRLPETAPGATELQLDGAQLAMLLDGVDLRQVRRLPHWRPTPAHHQGIDKTSRV